MKPYFTSLTLVTLVWLQSITFAAQTSFSVFDSSQFDVTNRVVSLKAGATSSVHVGGGHVSNPNFHNSQFVATGSDITLKDGLTVTNLIESGTTTSDSTLTGSLFLGDGGTFGYRITPQTMSGYINFIPDTSAQTGFAFHTTSGTNVTETHVLLSEQEAYSAGTVYSLTATPALVDFGTTDPTITISVAGTYMISWGANVKYNGATFAANQTYTIKVRRTNNTAADISNASITQTTRIITTITDNAGLVGGKSVKYNATAGDILQVWGSLSATPSAGSVDITDAWIVINRIQ